MVPAVKLPAVVKPAPHYVTTAISTMGLTLPVRLVHGILPPLPAQVICAVVGNVNAGHCWQVVAGVYTLAMHIGVRLSWCLLVSLNVGAPTANHAACAM